MPPVRTREQRRPVELEGVGLHDGRSRIGVRQDLVEDRQEVAVELDGSDLGSGLDQGEGERTQPGPDLDHVVTRLDAGQSHDPPDRVGVDDEVLTEGPAGADAVAVEELLSLSPGDRHPASSPATR